MPQRPPPIADLTKLRVLDAASAAPMKAAAEAGTSTEQRQELAQTPATQVHPGVERWPVKTGTDADVAKVGQSPVNGKDFGLHAVATTVEEMRGFKRPADMPPVNQSFPIGSYYQDKRAMPVETTIWQVTTTVKGVKLEQDGDYHLVLQGSSGVTMIAEIPDPDPKFVKPSSPWGTLIKAARGSMDTKLGKPLTAAQFDVTAMEPPEAQRSRAELVEAQRAALVPVNASAVITGVGFFDSSHGQDGVAPNAIEIHPVLGLKFI